jgi:hypothetical protein
VLLKPDQLPIFHILIFIHHFKDLLVLLFLELFIVLLNDLIFPCLYQFSESFAIKIGLVISTISSNLHLLLLKGAANVLSPF